MSLVQEVVLLEFAAPCPFDRREQPLGVRGVSQQVCRLSDCVLVLFRQDDRVSVSRHDLDGGVVVVDLLDESEQTFACFRRGDRRHDRYSTAYSMQALSSCWLHREHSRQDGRRAGWLPPRRKPNLCGLVSAVAAVDDRQSA